jgi:hypothetical protein
MTLSSPDHKKYCYLMYSGKKNMADLEALGQIGSGNKQITWGNDREGVTTRFVNFLSV